MWLSRAAHRGTDRCQFMDILGKAGQRHQRASSEYSWFRVLRHCKRMAWETLLAALVLGVSWLHHGWVCLDSGVCESGWVRWYGDVCIRVYTVQELDLDGRIISDNQASADCMPCSLGVGVSRPHPHPHRADGGPKGAVGGSRWGPVRKFPSLAPERQGSLALILPQYVVVSTQYGRYECVRTDI